MAHSAEFWRTFLAKCMLVEALAPRAAQEPEGGVRVGRKCPWKGLEAFEAERGVCYRTLSGTEYTYGDFLALVDGRRALARCLFDLCVWQHPETLLHEFEEEGIRWMGEGVLAL